MYSRWLASLPIAAGQSQDLRIAILVPPTGDIFAVPRLAVRDHDGEFAQRKPCPPG
jgi:hypothetical protein